MNNFPSLAPTSAPAYQPTSRPRNQSIAYTEFLYVSLALILLIVLICLIMCGLKRLCHKKSICDRLCGRYEIDENQDVEVIVETVAVVDNSNYAECDLEAGHLSSSQSGRHGQSSNSMRERGSLKRYGSWFGYGPQRSGQSLAVAQEYQGNSAIVLGQAAPMRVMDTFQDLNDYNTNTNNVARAARLTLLSTLPTNNLPASRTAAATLDSRDVVLDDAVSRAYGGDHDYLIETERNMGEVNDQFMRFTAAHNLNLAYSGSREGGLSSRDRGTGVETGAGIGTGIGAVQDCVGPSDSSRQCSAVVAEPDSNSILSSTNRRIPSSSDILAALADACHSDTLDGIAGGVETREAHAASHEPVSESSRASSIVVEESKEDRDVSSASSLNSLSGIVVDSDDYNSNFCRLPPLQPLGSLSTNN